MGGRSRDVVFKDERTSLDSAIVDGRPFDYSREWSKARIHQKNGPEGQGVPSGPVEVDTQG